MGRRSRLPSFHVMFVELPARGQGAPAVEHLARSIDGDHAPGPARRLERQVPLAAAEVGDVERRQQQSERASPCRPAPAGHELPPVVPRLPVPREALLPHPPHFRQPRIVGPRFRRRAIELALEPGPATRRGRWPSRASARRYQAKAPARSSVTSPASRRRPRCRDTPDCATPRMAVSSDTFSASRDSTRSRRSRVASPSSRRRVVASDTSTNLYIWMSTGQLAAVRLSRSLEVTPTVPVRHWRSHRSGDDQSGGA